MFYNHLLSLTSIISPIYFCQVFFKLLFIFSISYALAYLGIKYFIKIITKKQICRQPIRAEGPESHLKNKKNTPTMGGLFIILGTLIATLLFANIKNSYVLIALFVMTSFSIIGFIDDYMKVTGKGSKGFRGSIKLVIQFLIVTTVMFWLKMTNDIYFNGLVSIPFTKLSFDLGIYYIFFATLVIVGTANAVNLTDGLDGLVSVPTIIVLLCFIGVIYATSSKTLASDLGIPNIQNTSALIMFCAALVGAVLAFLKFNLKPAKIFMGDVGSLGIGASLGALAVILKKELMFGIMGLLFVAEAMSVILQVTSYKLRKKRIFLMAPLHHHFEKKGWSEQKVVRIFWLASVIFAAIGMLSLIISI